MAIVTTAPETYKYRHQQASHHSKPFWLLRQFCAKISFQYLFNYFSYTLAPE